MFGYIKPLRPELRLWEDAYFRAAYCGLCRSMGRTCGQAARLTLTFDMTALALFLDAAAEEGAQKTRFRCPIHPLRPRDMLLSPQIDFAARLGTLLACGKLRDDVADEGALSARAALMMLKGSEKRAQSALPAVPGVIEKRLAENAAVEKAFCALPDAAAEPFALLMAESILQAPGLKNEPAWRWLGYNLGKWVYLIDAWADRAEDAARQEYNVWNACGADAAAAQRLMEACLEQAGAALDLLELPRNRALCENILYAGCARQMENVLKEEPCGKKSLHCAGCFRERQL